MIVYSSENIVQYQLYIVEYINECWKVEFIAETKRMKIGVFHFMYFNCNIFHYLLSFFVFIWLVNFIVEFFTICYLSLYVFHLQNVALFVILLSILFANFSTIYYLFLMYFICKMLHCSSSFLIFFYLQILSQNTSLSVIFLYVYFVCKYHYKMLHYLLFFFVRILLFFSSLVVFYFVNIIAKCCAI